MTKAEELYSRYHREIFRYLAHMTGRRDVAEDLAQDVFLKIVGALQNGDSIGHERGWVFSIARTTLINRFHSENRRIANTETEDPVVESNQGLAFDLSQSLERLSTGDRDMLLMKEVAGLTYKEIAQICGVSIESVRARLYRARCALRQLMKPLAVSVRNSGK